MSTVARGSWLSGEGRVRRFSRFARVLGTQPMLLQTAQTEEEKVHKESAREGTEQGTFTL